MITHINKKNKPTIVDISNKKITERIATAQGTVKFRKSTFDKIKSLKTKKGEIKSVAIIAGIIGAKKTSEIIPLCHNIKIEKIDIDIKIEKNNCLYKVFSTVKTTEKTGVEMEALCSVSLACLSIYDMCKSLDKKIIIKDIFLVKKKGGKTDFENK